MLLSDMAEVYAAEGRRIGARLAALRRLRRAEIDAERRAEIAHQIAVLGGIQSDCYAIAQVCARYYERGYYRDPRYTFNGR